MPRARARAIRRSIGSAGLFLVLSVAALSAACSSRDAASPDTSSLVVERTTEGDVTTVRNVSGSSWGGPAHLVEELSIGVLEGDEAYMFGRIGGLWVTDENVYVVDTQVPTIRVYDLQGSHLRDIGREGQGPGEFDRPGRLVVLDDGTVVIDDNGNSRLVFFDAEGAPLRTWKPEEGYIFGLFLLDDGTLLIRRGLPPEEGDSGPGFIVSHEVVAPLTADGVLGESRVPPDLGFEPEFLVVQQGGGAMVMAGGILFRPERHWTVRPDGSLVVGVSDRYRFEVHHPDDTVTAVSKSWEPVPVDPEEVEYAIARIEGQFRQMYPSWTYDGPPAADTKPAFQSLVADRDGRVWALRDLEGQRQEDCFEDPREDPAEAAQRPCWKPHQVVDAFSPDGSYLGELQRPEQLRFRSVFIRGDEYWAAVEDEDGLLTVKRFRIVTPATT